MLRCMEKKEAEKIMEDVVPQNFPSHFTQGVPIEVLKLLKDD